MTRLRTTFRTTIANGKSRRLLSTIEKLDPEQLQPSAIQEDEEVYSTKEAEEEGAREATKEAELIIYLYHYARFEPYLTLAQSLEVELLLVARTSSI